MNGTEEKKMSEKKAIYANTLSDVFFQKRSISNLKLLGGCTAIKEFPEMFLSTLFIKELATIDKRERYIDFGPAVTLAEILDIGEEHLPRIFYEAVSGIANPIVRNVATLGGNICDAKWKHTTIAPMLALDARIEISRPRTNGLITETQYIPFTKFEGIPEDFLLTKIRIPVEEWDVEVFRRFGPSHAINENSASFAFLASSQKNQLSNLRIAFAGPFSFRNKELENRLLGASLPLPEASIKELVDEASIFYDEAAYNTEAKPILKQQFLNVLRYSLSQLT